MRTGYDSVNPASIPASAAVVLGYVNGRYAWQPADWGRFPHAVKIRIDVNGTDPFGSDVIDVERYDATPAVAAGWVRERMARGWWSAAYVDKANWPALQAACKGLHVVYWVADWTGEPHLVPGSVATQYKNTPGYDVSAVENAWFPRSAW